MAIDEEKETVSINQNQLNYDNIATNGYSVQQKRLEPIARVLLMAVYDDTHDLSQFRGMRYIIKAIWQFVLQFNKNIWYTHIDHPMTERNGDQYIASMDTISFPKSQDININMMPFIMHTEFEKTMLPKYLSEYHKQLIIPCTDHATSNLDKICYLTIQESFVQKGKTQRRPGLHVEIPGNVIITNDEQDKVKYNKGKGFCYARAWWGGGINMTDMFPSNGIYMASNVSGSCAVWNCKIKKKIGHLGNVEHLRGSLQNKRIMEEDTLYWITDRTPHESLPMKEDGYRQFFRLVTHKVSVWYEQHSTKNPKGVVPDPKITTIIKGNKFNVSVSDDDKYVSDDEEEEDDEEEDSEDF